MQSPDHPDVWTYLTVVIISIVSGIVSITRRIALGQRYSFVWFVSEFLAAILCGYLAYETYPSLEVYLPDWFNMPVLVAVSAHSGGRVLQLASDAVYERISDIKNPGRRGGGK